jgi:dolichyl-phosphate beta-glucosyltransferase
MMLSVIIPTYNEEANILSSLTKAMNFLKGKPYEYEILVSDDGSNDKTLPIVNDFLKSHPEVRLIQNAHTGKAGAVLKGMREARGGYILFTDADFATPIETIDTMVGAFENGADVVIGSRAQGKRENEPLSRKIAGKGFNILTQVILLPGIDDTQAGFKAFTKAATDKILNAMVHYQTNQPVITRPNVTAFDVEMLFIARKFGYKVISIPIAWEYRPSTRVSVIRDSYKLLTDLLSVRLNDLKGKYKVS